MTRPLVLHKQRACATSVFDQKYRNWIQIKWKSTEFIWKSVSWNLLFFMWLCSVIASKKVVNTSLLNLCSAHSKQMQNANVQRSIPKKRQHLKARIPFESRGVVNKHLKLWTSLKRHKKEHKGLVWLLQSVTIWSRCCVIDIVVIANHAISDRMEYTHGSPWYISNIYKSITISPTFHVFPSTCPKVTC